MSWIEKSMMQVVWSSLEEKGWQVWGEQGEGDSRLDLVCELPSAGYVVIECKAGPALEKFILGNEILDQLYRYLTAYSLSGIAICVPEQDAGMLSQFKERRLQTFRSEHSSRNLYVLQRLHVIASHVFPPGIVSITEASIPQTSKLDLALTHGNEEDLKHRIWKAIVRKEPFVSQMLENLGLHSSVSANPVCEGIIRKSYENTKDQIDIALLIGSKDPYSQELKAIVGIEAKNDLSDSSIPFQLDKYLDSENLSQLYLAVPASLARRAKNLIASSKSKHSTKIGIVSVRSECTNQPALDSFGTQN
ncbi:MAG: hypothetical protein ACRECH_15955, partial [Nitrososphaerales archaeon]